MRKKLLILGAGNAQIDLIEYARDAGFEIYGCSYTNTDKGIPLLDHFAMIDITDAGKIEKYVMENRDRLYLFGGKRYCRPDNLQGCGENREISFCIKPDSTALLQ